jgi:hypothetical protein
MDACRIPAGALLLVCVYSQAATPLKSLVQKPTAAFGRWKTVNFFALFLKAPHSFSASPFCSALRPRHFPPIEVQLFLHKPVHSLARIAPLASLAAYLCDLSPAFRFSLLCLNIQNAAPSARTEPRHDERKGQVNGALSERWREPKGNMPPCFDPKTGK